MRRRTKIIGLTTGATFVGLLDELYQQLGEFKDALRETQKAAGGALRKMSEELTNLDHENIKSQKRVQELENEIASLNIKASQQKERTTWLQSLLGNCYEVGSVIITYHSSYYSHV